MTRDEIKNLLRMALECYPYYKDKIDDPKIVLDIWELSLSDRNATDVFKAFRFHINHSKFFPTPADIMEAMPKARIVYEDMPTTPQIGDGKPTRKFQQAFGFDLAPEEREEFIDRAIDYIDNHWGEPIKTE